MFTDYLSNNYVSVLANVVQLCVCNVVECSQIASQCHYRSMMLMKYQVTVDIVFMFRR